MPVRSGAKRGPKKGSVLQKGIDNIKQAMERREIERRESMGKQPGAAPSGTAANP